MRNTKRVNGMMRTMKSGNPTGAGHVVCIMMQDTGVIGHSQEGAINVTFSATWPVPVNCGTLSR